MRINPLLAASLILGCALQTPLNRYGLPVIDSVAIYQRSVRLDSSKAMIDLARHAPSIRLDIRYASENNFMGKVLYPEARAFLRLPAADAIRAIQQELSAEGIGLKIFDAYRPYHVTEMMWEPYKDPNYVADPAKGSRHNRGAAVDVTLVRLDSGEELAMPTAYDDFTPRAAHAFTDLPAEVLENRARLRAVMEKHGFEALESEWWHYDYTGWRRFELMDLPFSAFGSQPETGAIGERPPGPIEAASRRPSQTTQI
ncbi:MAG TPA: M15 family metallopeptidase [Thermoanaerobaculia bacterium]|nr:M15 family metallopeptidase [Thermoanaerobaculia bacterium]